MPIWVLQILQIVVWPLAVLGVAFVLRSAVLGWARSRSQVALGRRLRAHVEALEQRLSGNEEQERLATHIAAQFDPSSEAIRIANAVAEIPPVAREKMKPRLQEYLGEAVRRSSRLAAGCVVETLRKSENGIR
ncbi:MAG: hypothetical protein HYY96_15420 [Candidatus Tectomicrobia bacterium]|nr:hypothetical protein [Candidatus Tectomicrobia bacterium]